MKITNSISLPGAGFSFPQYRGGVSAALKLIPFAVFGTAMACDKPRGTMRSLFFEGADALLRVSYDKQLISPDAVIDKVNACGLDWLNGTIEQPLEKVSSCVCSMSVASFNNPGSTFSTMDLFGENITANQTECVTSGLKEVCFSTPVDFTGLAVTAGIVGTLCLAYCCARPVASLVDRVKNWRANEDIALQYHELNDQP